MTPPLDLVIVGAGPSGLATAIAAHQAGLVYEVLEKGALVNSIFHFPRHMTFFTTAELLEIGGLPFVTPFEKPTQAEGLKYYRKVTETYGLRVALGEEVTAVRPLAGADGGARFAVETRGKEGATASRRAPRSNAYSAAPTPATSNTPRTPGVVRASPASWISPAPRWTPSPRPRCASAR